MLKFQYLHRLMFIKLHVTVGISIVDEFIKGTIAVLPKISFSLSISDVFVVHVLAF